MSSGFQGQEVKYVIQKIDSAKYRTNDFYHRYKLRSRAIDKDDRNDLVSVSHKLEDLILKTQIKTLQNNRWLLAGQGLNKALPNWVELGRITRSMPTPFWFYLKRLEVCIAESEHRFQIGQSKLPRRCSWNHNLSTMILLLSSMPTMHNWIQLPPIEPLTAMNANKHPNGQHIQLFISLMLIQAFYHLLFHLLDPFSFLFQLFVVVDVENSQPQLWWHCPCCHGLNNVRFLLQQWQ